MIKYKINAWKIQKIWRILQSLELPFFYVDSSSRSDTSSISIPSSYFLSLENFLSCSYSPPFDSTFTHFITYTGSSSFSGKENYLLLNAQSSESDDEEDHYPLYFFSFFSCLSSFLWRNSNYFISNFLPLMAWDSSQIIVRKLFFICSTSSVRLLKCWENHSHLSSSINKSLKKNALSSSYSLVLSISSLGLNELMTIIASFG